MHILNDSSKIISRILSAIFMISDKIPSLNKPKPSIFKGDAILNKFVSLFNLTQINSSRNRRTNSQYLKYSKW